MDRDLQELRRLIRVGDDPRNRTLANFRNIVRKMELIDSRAPLVELVSAIVHLSFYWRGRGITSVIEDLGPLFKYPKKESRRLIQDQIQINDRLKQAFSEFGEELKDNWKLMYRPGDGAETNLAHALSALECRIRSGRFMRWLYSYGGDHFKSLFGREKLDPHDWAGDEVGKELVAAWGEAGRGATLSEVLVRGEVLSQILFRPPRPAGGIAVPRDAGPPPLHAALPGGSAISHAVRPSRPVNSWLGGLWQQQQASRAQRQFQEMQRQSRMRKVQDIAPPRSPLPLTPPPRPVSPTSPGVPPRPGDAIGGPSLAEMARKRALEEALRRRMGMERARAGQPDGAGPKPWWRRGPLVPPLGPGVPNGPAPPGPLSPSVSVGPTTLIYTVSPRDTLWDMSRRAYGDPHFWPRIWEANRDIIGANPHRILPNQRLRIPPLTPQSF